MAAHIDVGSMLVMIAAVIILAKAASAVFDRFGLPGLIGEILVGIFIANLVIGDWSLMGTLGLIGEYTDADGNTVPATNRAVLDALAEIGVIFLLFAVGLETRVKELMSVGRAAFLVALMGVITPFILGYAFIMIQDGNTMHALFMGAAMVATSVGITARVIKDLGLMDTKESRIIIGAAVIDDVMGLVVLAIVAGMAKSSDNINIGNILFVTITAAVFVLAVILFCRNGLPKIYGYFETRRINGLGADKDRTNRPFSMFALAIVTCLALACISQAIGLAAIVGAFLAGMIFADRASEWDLHAKFRSLNVFLVPFFFVAVGLKVDLGAFTSEVLMIWIAIIILAVISKYVGCFTGAKIADGTIDRTSGNIIGIGMIPRGEVGIIIASIGFSTYGVITGELYTVVVMMSVVTALIAPIFLSRAFRKKYC